MTNQSCPSCAAAASPGAIFCSACGADLPTGQAGTPRTAASAWVIGSAPGCDIVVPGSSVSSRHCRVTCAGNTYTIEDLGSANGTWVSGARINAPTQISRNEPVTLGRNVPLRWELLHAPNGSSAGPLAHGARVIRIGRSPDNQVVLDYPTVSGENARNIAESRGALIEDLGSLH